MKNLSLAVITFALLWGLSGCAYHGNHHLSGYYADDSFYTQFHSGPYVYGYPWISPFNFFAYGHDYGYGYPYYYWNHHSHYDSHRHGHYRKHGDHRRHDGHRKHKRHLNRGDFSGERHLSRDRPRTRPRSDDTVTRVTRPTEPRQQIRAQQTTSPRQQVRTERSRSTSKKSHKAIKAAQKKHSAGKAVVRSERRHFSKGKFKQGDMGDGRRVVCPGGRC